MTSAPKSIKYCPLCEAPEPICPKCGIIVPHKSNNAGCSSGTCRRCNEVVFVDWGASADPVTDLVESPAHYTWIPGIECHQVSVHFSCMTGAAIELIWRHRHKGHPIQDLEKAIERLKFEIELLKSQGETK